MALSRTHLRRRGEVPIQFRFYMQDPPTRVVRSWAVYIYVPRCMHTYLGMLYRFDSRVAEVEAGIYTQLFIRQRPRKLGGHIKTLLPSSSPLLCLSVCLLYPLYLFCSLPSFLDSLGTIMLFFFPPSRHAPPLSHFPPSCCVLLVYPAATFHQAPGRGLSPPDSNSILSPFVRRSVIRQEGPRSLVAAVPASINPSESLSTPLPRFDSRCPRHTRSRTRELQPKSSS